MLPDERDRTPLGCERPLAGWPDQPADIRGPRTLSVGKATGSNGHGHIDCGCAAQRGTNTDL